MTVAPNAPETQADDCMAVLAPHGRPADRRPQVAHGVATASRRQRPALGGCPRPRSSIFSDGRSLRPRGAGSGKVLPRRHSANALEVPRQVALVIEAGLTGGARRGKAAAHQFLGALHPQLADVPMRGDAHLLAEHRGKSPDAQAREFGKLREAEGLAKVRFDMPQHPLNGGDGAGNASGCRIGEHGSELRRRAPEIAPQLRAVPASHVELRRRPSKSCGASARRGCS